MCMWSGADCFFNLFFFFLSVLSLFYYLRGCHVPLIPKGGSNSSTSCLTTIKDEQQQASNYQRSANEVLWSLTLLPWWLCGWRSLHTAMLKQALVSRERNRVFIWYWRGHLNTEPVFVPLCDALTSSECRITQCQNYRERLRVCSFCIHRGFYSLLYKNELCSLMNTSVDL